ncbi:MAG: KEOPS complex subunit Pcc1 [Archaeoglobaceae archaeon]
MRSGMRAEFTLKGKEPHLIYESLKIETSSRKANIYLREDGLIINLRTDDVTELRAAINGWLRLIKMCEKMLEVLE